MSDSVRPYGLQSARFLCPWDSPGMHTGVGCHTLLQGISPVQESDLCLLHLSPALAGGFFTIVPPGKPRLEVSLSKRWKLFTSLLVQFIGESCLSAKYLQSYIAWFRTRAQQPQQLNVLPSYVKSNDLNCAVWVSSYIK